jgi:hypothetical protein
MATRYVPFTISAFTAVMDRLGFVAITIHGTHEYVFERAFEEDRFSVRIYSSITIGADSTRGCGEDAIRVLIYDRVMDRNTHTVIVHRTKNALTNVVARARDMWTWKKQNKCSCGSIMVVREGRGTKFLGCTSYPNCKNTRQIE